MKVSFNCSKDSIVFFTDVLGALKDCSKPVKVRVGGLETHFININSIDSINVNGPDMDSGICFYAKSSSFGFFSDFLKKFEAHNFITELNFSKVRIGGREFHVDSDYCIESLLFDVTVGDSFSNVVVNDIDASDDNDDGDSDEVIAVREIIADKIRNDIMFTAFDITKELRKNGHKVRHSNIRNIVHGLFYNGDITGYTRTIIEVNGERPFVYHPILSDASLYLM